MPTKKKANIGDLDPGSDEWMAAYNALSPTDQAAVFNQQANAPAFDFQQAVTDAPDPLGWGQIAGTDPEGWGQFGTVSPVGGGTGYATPGGFGDIGLDPAYQQLLQAGGGVNIPSLTSAGKLEPYDIGQEASRVNLMQDNASSIADIILSSLAGPGALDPASFAPVVTEPTERISTPGLTQLDRYAQGTGYKAYVAKKIRDEGATDDEALADLYNFISAPDDPSIPPEAKAARQEIIDSLPSAFNTGGGQVQLPSGNGKSGPARTSQDTRSLFDESNISKWANDLYFKVADDQANVDVGYQDPKTGFWYKDSPTEEDSPAAAKFKNLGLPTPFAQYNDPQYLQMAYDAAAPNLDASMQAREQNIGQTQADQDRIGQESRGPIDRNINVQKLLSQNGGMRSVPNAPPQPAVPPVVPGRTQGATLSFGQGVGQPDIVGSQPPRGLSPIEQRAGGAQMMPLQGFQNPQGGFDFNPDESATKRALANAALNFNFGMGGGKRPTKPVALNQNVGKQSQKAADTARRAYADANTKRYQASQASTPDLAAAVRALATANVAADSGRKPFTDAVMQRLLGQRAVGVRGL
jgi:hypothetical protein